MMEYPGKLMPKQYENGGPLTRAEARALAKQYEETGELTPQMEEKFSNMSENERQFVSDIISSGRLSSDRVFGNMVESALKGNQPLHSQITSDLNSSKTQKEKLRLTTLREYDLYGNLGRSLMRVETKANRVIQTRGSVLKRTDLLRVTIC